MLRNDRFRKAFRLITSLFGLARPKTWGPFIETYKKTRFDHAFEVSWSQGGEDIGLVNALSGITTGNFLDIGAHHPSRFSVTRKLVELGWSGVNVEANPSLMHELEKHRPRDVSINAAVGKKSSYELIIFNETAISTVNEGWASRFSNEGQKVESRVNIPGITVSQICEKHFFLGGGFPNLLCIDAEGSDLEILQTANLRNDFGPEWILVEANPPLKSVMQNDSVRYLVELDWEIYLILNFSVLLRNVNVLKSSDKNSR